MDEQLPTRLVLGDEFSTDAWVVAGTPMITPSNEALTLDTATLEAWRFKAGQTARDAIRSWTLGMELTAYGLAGFYLTSVAIKRIIRDPASGVDSLIGVTLTALGMVQDKPIRKTYMGGIMETDAYTFYEAADTLTYRVEGIVLDGTSLPALTPTKVPSQYPQEFMTGQLRDQEQVTWDPMPQCYPQKPSGWVMTSDESRKIDYTPWVLATRTYEYRYPFIVQ